jgi:hypothetical protein
MMCEVWTRRGRLERCGEHRAIEDFGSWVGIWHFLGIIPGCFHCRLRTWVFRTYPGPSTGDTRTQGFRVGWLPSITRVFGWHPGASARDFGGDYSAP